MKSRTLLFLLLMMAPGLTWALDAPHNNTNNIQCMSCHSAHTKSTVGYLLTTGTSIESFCQSCHNGVRAPYEVGHSHTSTGSTKYTWNRTCTDCHSQHNHMQWRAYPTQALLFTSTVSSLTPCRLVASGSPGWPVGYWNDFTLTFQGNPPPSNGSSSLTATTWKITDTTGGNTLWVRITDTCSTTYTPNTLLYRGSAGSSFNIFYGRLVKNSIVGALGPTAVRFFTQAVSGSIRNTLSDNTSPYEDEVCNTCHSLTGHHQYDGTAPDGQNHNDGFYCVSCHPHTKGFAPSESEGGENCASCHADLFAALNDNTATSYHHYINNAAATYPVIGQPATLGGQADTNRRCLMCHADHNLFRPDINTLSGGRAKNLRSSISVAPTTTTAGSFTNTDFLAADVSVWSGGICLSCHNQAQTKSFTQPDGSASTPNIPYPGSVSAQVQAYDLSAHQYTATSYFSGALVSGTAMDCVKCHNDDMSPKSDKNAQKSAIKFGLHDSTLRRMWPGMNVTGPADPLGDPFCLQCHGPSTTYQTTGSGADYYGVTTLTLRAENMAALFSDATLPYKHGVTNTTYYTRHRPGSGDETRAYLSANKHVQCEDCHNAHSSRAGTHISGTNLLSGAIFTGVSGALPTWTSSPMTAALWGTTTSPATRESEICFQCHSSFNTGLTAWFTSGTIGVDAQFNPYNRSFHPVWTQNPYRNTGLANTAFVTGSGFTQGSTMYCSDCHNNSKNAAYDPNGPHASANPRILTAPFVNASRTSNIAGATGRPGTYNHLCFLCHDQNTYTGSINSGVNPNTGYMAGGTNLHIEHFQRQATNSYIACTHCHSAMPHGFNSTSVNNGNRALIVLQSDPYPYNRGNAALTRFVRNTGNYNTGNCSASVTFDGGCAGVHP